MSAADDRRAAALAAALRIGQPTEETAKAIAEHRDFYAGRRALRATAEQLAGDGALEDRRVGGDRRAGKEDRRVTRDRRGGVTVTIDGVVVTKPAAEWKRFDATPERPSAFVLLDEVRARRRRSEP